MTTEKINEIIAKLPSTFKKCTYRVGESRQFGTYLKQWDVYFPVGFWYVQATILMGERKCYVKGVEYCDLYVNSVYVRGERIECLDDIENRNALEKLKQKILEIVKRHPVYEKNLKMFNV